MSPWGQMETPSGSLLVPLGLEEDSLGSLPVPVGLEGDSPGSSWLPPYCKGCGRNFPWIPFSPWHRDPGNAEDCSHSPAQTLTLPVLPRSLPVPPWDAVLWKSWREDVPCYCDHLLCRPRALGYPSCQEPFASFPSSHPEEGAFGGPVVGVLLGKRGTQAACALARGWGGSLLLSPPRRAQLCREFISCDSLNPAGVDTSDPAGIWLLSRSLIHFEAFQSLAAALCSAPGTEEPPARLPVSVMRAKLLPPQPRTQGSCGAAAAPLPLPQAAGRARRPRRDGGSWPVPGG